MLALVSVSNTYSCSAQPLRRHAPCRKYFNKPRGLACMARCRGDVLCVARCLEKHGQISAIGTATLSCVTVFLYPDDPGMEIQLESCLQLHQPSPTATATADESFGTAMLRGIPKMAECAVGACRSSYTKVSNTLSCAEQCRTDRSQTVFPFLFLNRALSCVFECMVE